MTPVPIVPAVIVDRSVITPVPVFILAALPPHYAIDFVSALDTVSVSTVSDAVSGSGEFSRLISSFLFLLVLVQPNSYVL